MPDPDAKPPRPTKRRLPILARHAISLGIVFVLALPLSYVGIRNYLQQQNVAQLDETDPATFEQGLAYVYANAGTNPDVMHAAVDRIKALPDDRAIELHRVLLIAYSDHETEVDDHVTRAGAELMDRLPMPDAILVYRHTEAAGRGDESVMLEALDRQLKVADDRQFLQLVDYYDSRATWSRDAVPADAWLRWLVMLSYSNAELTQRLIARQLGELPEQADEPQIDLALERLSSSPFPGVRAQVLKSAAGYAAIAEDPTDYEQIIFTLGQDENQTIARRAWQIVGHLDPLSGFSPNWQDAPPYVAEAILWAAVKTNPDQVGPAIDAWDSGNQTAAAMAFYQSGTQSYGPLAKEADERLLSILSSTTLSQEDALLLWRALPNLHRNWDALIYEDYKRKAFETVIRITGTEEQRMREFSGLIAACCFYSFSGYMPSLQEHDLAPYLLAWAEYRERPPIEAHDTLPVFIDSSDLWVDRNTLSDELDPFNPFNKLKDYPNLTADDLRTPYYDSGYTRRRPVLDLFAHAADPSGYELGVPFDSLFEQADHLRCLWLAANFAYRSPRTDYVKEAILPDSIRGNTVSETTSAALLSALLDTRPPLIRGVTADFLRNHPDITDDDLHAMTDEQLAEFGLRRVDAVQALLDVAESNPDPVQRYETMSLLKLALWMRGDLGDDFTPEAEAMLLDPRLPTSTVLLALLHKQRPIALEYLFGDLIEPNPDLAELFIGERFWHVFRRFVKTDEMDLWLWGDPAAQDFQIEAMRQWYWVNRYLIDDCWIDD